MKLVSSAFSHQGEIPAIYTCEGRNVSPPLSWSNMPENARSLALIVDDPDAPDPAHPKRPWVHWVLYNLPPMDGKLEEGAPQPPQGTLQGKNDWHRTGYGGPCPPIGRHRYLFKLYALDTPLADLSEPSKATLQREMHDHVIGETMLMGTYQKATHKT